jgi:hypothetical protein
VRSRGGASPQDNYPFWLDCWLTRTVRARLVRTKLDNGFWFTSPEARHLEAPDCQIVWFSGASKTGLGVRLGRSETWSHSCRDATDPHPPSGGWGSFFARELMLTDDYTRYCAPGHLSVGCSSDRGTVRPPVSPLLPGVFRGPARTWMGWLRWIPSGRSSQLLTRLDTVGSSEEWFAGGPIT